MPPGTDSFPRFQEEGEEGVTRQRPVREAKFIKNSNKYIEQLRLFKWKTYDIQKGNTHKDF